MEDLKHPQTTHTQYYNIQTWINTHVSVCSINRTLNSELNRSSKQQQNKTQIT